jgi:hypothetical protein
MLMVVCLFFGFNVHLNSETGSGEKDGLIICCKLACISHFIVNVLISDTKDMLNGEILFGGFVVSSGITCLFEMTWLLDLAFVVWSCVYTLAFRLLKAVVLLIFRILFGFNKILCIIDFIRIVLPDNDGFFLSANADKILTLFIF